VNNLDFYYKLSIEKQVLITTSMDVDKSYNSIFCALIIDAT